MSKILGLLFFTGLAICLLQIWLPEYYLTGDGPSHVYNAKIIHDLWCGTDVGFYQKFYQLSSTPNPNWFTHAVLAALMFLVNGVAGEKILLSIYVVVFICGFLKLSQVLGGGYSWMMLVVFMLVFNVPFSKGFYNFAISTALFFWVTWGYLYYLKQRNATRFLLLVLFTTLTYFAHPIGFILGAMTTWSVLLTKALIEKGFRNLRIISLQALLLLLSQLPALALLLRFVANKDGVAFGIGLHKYRIRHLFEFPSFATHDHHEIIYAVLFLILLFITFCILVWVTAIRDRNLTMADSLLLPIVFTILAYFTFPDSFLGGGVFVMRMQLFFFLLLALYVSAKIKHRSMGYGVGILSFVLFTGVSMVRARSIQEASDGVHDLLSIRKYIKPYSTVLPLNFAPNGKTRTGTTVTDLNWIFTHAQDYNGAYMPLIMLDNYEANTTYFPLSWNAAINPYHFLSKEEGIESTPPYAAIDVYKQEAGVSIDYIVMWGYDTSFATKGLMPHLMEQINRRYAIIYTSPSGRTILYGHK